MEEKRGAKHLRVMAHLIAAVLLLLTSCHGADAGNTKSESKQRKTQVSIRGEDFLINGIPTFKGRVWNGYRIEGLLPNSRMVQGIFDDLNLETRERWVYPDTKQWDPERNTGEFIQAMQSWHDHGLLAFTLNMQGGSPMGYGNKFWYNTAYTSDGELRAEYMVRLEKILDKADETGMVVILGLFYFGQDQNLEDETAVIHAVDHMIDWLHSKHYRNVMIEVNNECNISDYDHSILKEENVHELILRIRNHSHKGYSYPTGTSLGGNSIPPANIVKVSDFILLHGNGVNRPERIAEMIRLTKEVDGFRTMPVLFNEDDHYDFDKPENNMVAAIREHVSWGFFDFRREGEAFEEGYQCPPVDWGINSDRKTAFFSLLSDITGYHPGH